MDRSIPVERVRGRTASRNGPHSHRHRSPVMVAGSGVVIVALLVVAGLRSSTAPVLDSAGATAPTSELAAVAPDVQGQPWLVQVGDGPWLWGEAGSAGRTEIRDGVGLGVSRTWVATATDAKSGTQIRLTDRSGKVIADRVVPVTDPIAAAAGTDLVLIGHGPTGNRGDLVLLDGRTGDLHVVLPGAPYPDVIGPDAATGPLRVSQTGRTVATYACHDGLCETIAARLDSGEVRAIASGAEGFLRAVTDELAVFTDDNGTWIRALEIDTGLVRWELKGWSLDGTASVTADGSIAATMGEGGNWAVRLVRPDGVVTDLTSPGSALLDVWGQVSTPTTVVVATESFGEGLGDPAGAQASLIRPADSKTLATSITVVPAQ